MALKAFNIRPFSFNTENEDFSSRKSVGVNFSRTRVQFGRPVNKVGMTDEG